jgi:DNA ligase-4
MVSYLNHNVDLKIGMSETSVFDVYHPQAKELYSVTSDLKKVCEKLQDPFARIGKSVRIMKPIRNTKQD